MRKSSPAWSLRGRTADPTLNEVPGPGTYNPTIIHLDKSPEYRIGKSNRLVHKSIEIPGPGSYNPGIPGKLSPRAM